MVAGSHVLLVDLAAGVAPVEGYIDHLRGRVARFFAYSGELTNEEPALDTGPGAYQIEFATCAKLLNYPDAAPPAGLRLRPEIAAAMPTVSADGRTYTFTVRPGYRFSPPSNEPVTAQTFRHSIERALSPELARGPTVPAPPGPRYLRDIVGEGAFLDGAAQHISGLRARGRRLTVTLTRPSTDFLERLALPYFCPVPTETPRIPGAPHLVRADGEGRIVSAGPYYVADYNDGYVILKRNPGYIGSRTRAFDAIAIREGADVSHALDRIQKGRWDGITNLAEPGLEPGGAVARRWGTTGSARPGHQRYFLIPRMATRFIAFNSTNGIFADPLVRRAAALALDRRALATAWGVVPSDQPLSPAFIGFKDRRLYRLSPSTKQANRLMAGRTGRALMPIPSGCPRCVESARIVQRDLGAVGIDVRVRRVDSVASNRSDSRFDLVDLRSELPYPDPASFVERILGDVPAGWVPTNLSVRASDTMAMNGDKRFAAAASLADRLDRGEVVLTAYGTPQTPEFLAPRIGCRVFTPVGDGVDLAHLCPAHR
jgi:ABC-type oligopeptide transport system substrate-binding subunit